MFLRSLDDGICADRIRDVLSGVVALDDGLFAQLLNIPGCPSLFQALLTNCSALISENIVS